MRQDIILQKLLRREEKRQRETIDLIASENLASPSVLKFLGSVLTNKYSEGYPGKRYYPGNQYCDQIEKRAQENALKAFGLNPKIWSVNVQPYSGSPANLEIYFALLRFGETLMGMELAAGGHLTHGHSVNFSGRAYRVVSYGVNPQTGFLDYQKIAELALKHKPKIIVSGATAYPRQINFRKFGQIARKVKAYHLADISHIAGLIAAGLHLSPFPFADVVMTTLHKTLRGPRAGAIFSKKDLSSLIDRAVFPGMQGGPHNNVIAAAGEAFFEARQPAFKRYQKQVVKNAAALAAALKKQGFNLAAGGTDNHLLLIDLKECGLDGLTAEKRLEQVGIVANRNALSGDQSPFRPSGIRLGTSFVTSRGMREKEMEKIAQWVKQALRRQKSADFLKEEVRKFCLRF